MAQETVFRWLTPLTWLRKLHDISAKPTNSVARLLSNSSSTSADSCKSCIHALPALSTEVALEIYAHLDAVTLYQLTLVSREYRHTLIQHGSIWNPLVFDPHIPFDGKLLDSIVYFLVSFQLHLRISSARFDGTAIEASELEMVLRRLPYVSELSVAQCTRIDCYQVLNMLKSARARTDNDSVISASSQTGQAPFLHHLSIVHMRGLFPSERGVKSYAQELYVYGSIKKLLLRQRHNDLSESHYALYQFWVILRSRMMLIAGDNDFRPPWLPDELVHFIETTEQQDEYRPIADIEPCHLCHKNVTSIGSAVCKICGVSTPKSCAQCQCLQCANILCLKCYRQFCGGNTSVNHAGQENERNAALLPLSATAAAALVAMATTTSGPRPYCGMPWQMVRCRRCHISRRVCGSSACQKPFLTSERRLSEKWYCSSCKEKRRNDRWKARTRLLRRTTRPNDDFIQWND
ncbi:hypothetical protein BJV82DRAFT_623842 [Fennellomyces sp. T-0311]|nr:hypothetical protein BJV82DRAFT_623842 [Fennellomyces sp. T-0311]